MDNSDIDISIIIVNYNVKAYLTSLLSSIKKSSQDLSIQLIVVDNASIDGSVEYIRNNFPKIELIANKRNLGFGKANNRALPRCKGEYTLIINPDALVNENTLKVMKDYMDTHPDVGLSTCKLLDSNGAFSKDCLRNIPTPTSALFRVFGIEEFAQKSNWLPNYYMADQDPEEVVEVPIISGSFMFCRTDMLKKLEGFDEQFFMYFEDTDLCLRARELGYKLHYVPYTSIIHYRGESTKKDRIDHHITFNQSLYKFYKKHYQYGYSVITRSLINLGIAFRATFVYIRSLISKYYMPGIDTILLNILIVIAFILRYDLDINTLNQTYKDEYFAINVMATILFGSIGQYYDLYGKNKDSIVSLFKTNVWTFLGIALITFFLRDFAFSRLILIEGLFIGFVIMLVVRLIRRSRLRKTKNKSTYITAHRVIIVGTGDRVKKVIRKIRKQVNWNYEVVGIVGKNLSKTEDHIENIAVLGELKYLSDLTRMYKADQVIFILDGIQYNDVLQHLMTLTHQNVLTRIVPDSQEFILGKSNVEYLGEVPILDMEWPYQKNWNWFVKRSLDIGLSSLLIFLLAPIFLYWKLQNSHKKNFTFYRDEEDTFKIRLFTPSKSNRFKNFVIMLGYIFKGTISFVGAPLIYNTPPKLIYYKYGITGYRQINEHRFYREEEKQRLELRYLQNYKIWTDLEVLLKSLVSKRSVIAKIKEE